ncbi:endonuclease/exonuclease/phosphatase family protein [Vagococcus sp.]|uniref:endonuclease/exonuclease/phosphatase family protein n=1 Tax=Vagococcus sp. TaxID=1933889 RepID=UPI002FC6135B
MKEFCVATYNVRTDTDADRDWSWEYRKDKVIALITYHDWDVFGVQEISPNQTKDLSNIEGYDSFCVDRDGDGSGEGLGIFYKNNRFTCLDQGHFWLSDTPFSSSIHPKAAYKRIALWSILEDKENAKQVLVINTHLDNDSEIARKAGMKILLQLLQEKITKYPTILLGDFNSEEHESFHQDLKKIFIYGKNQDGIMQYGPRGTFQNFNYEMDWQDLEDIDYILYKEMTCIKYGVLTDSWNCRFLSDHFPVEATLKF